MACVGGLIVFLVSTGFVAALLGKARNERLGRERQGIKSQVGELRRAQSALDRLNAVLKENESTLEMLHRRLPESLQVGTIVADLDALARQSHVSIIKVAPGRAVPEELAVRTPVSLSCQGSFAGLHAFLYNLMHMDFVVRVERISMVKGALPDNCSMDVACSVYGRK